MILTLLIDLNMPQIIHELLQFIKVFKNLDIMSSHGVN